MFYRTLFNKETEVEEVEIDLTQYKKVYLITGVIINNIASPVIDFCKKSSGKINSVKYDFVHYTPIVHKYSIEKLDDILRIKHDSAKATCMHFGKVIDFNFINKNGEKSN